MASVDSVHRNIAEGLEKAFPAFTHITMRLKSPQNPSTLSTNLHLLENGLLRLVEALERKRDTDTWIDTLGIQEFNSI
jgi:hypothetical protein